MARKIYGEVAGKVLEIQNWRERASGDAVVMQPLDSDDAAAFRALRSKGMSDKEIFAVLHPDPGPQGEVAAPAPPSESPPAAPAPALSLPFEELPEAQLVFILEHVIGHRAESLAQLERGDLVNLVRFATKARRLALSFQG